MNQRRRGFTMVEMVVATGLSAVVLVASLGFYLYFIANWSKGQSQSTADMTSEIAVRQMASQLRMAYGVTLDSDGNGVTYSMPEFDDSGNLVQPMTPDGINYRIALSGGTLTETVGDTSRVLCTNVVLTDPNSSGGTGTYKIFTPANTGVLRYLSIMVVTQYAGYQTTTQNSRSRVTIALRNIPELTH